MDDMITSEDIKKHEEFWTEIEQFRLWLFWTTPREHVLLEGAVYCPYIPEPFINWTTDQFEKEIKRLQNLRSTSSFARPIKI